MRVLDVSTYVVDELALFYSRNHSLFTLLLALGLLKQHDEFLHAHYLQVACVVIRRVMACRSNRTSRTLSWKQSLALLR
jgi:hypothetical protein